MKTKVCVLAVIGVISLSGAAWANVMFDDSFTGAASTNWTNTGAATYSANVATFPSASSRDYLRTADADYGKADFVATVDAKGTDDAYGIPYFGLGTGTPDSDFYGVAGHRRARVCGTIPRALYRLTTVHNRLGNSNIAHVAYCTG